MRNGISNISSKFARGLEKKPLRTNHKQVETMLHTTPTQVEIYEMQMTNVKGNFTINADVSKVNKTHLISVSDPCYKTVFQQCSHLKGIQINDNNENLELPTYFIIDTSSNRK